MRSLVPVGAARDVVVDDDDEEEEEEADEADEDSVDDDNEVVVLFVNAVASLSIVSCWSAAALGDDDEPLIRVPGVMVALPAPTAAAANSAREQFALQNESAAAPARDPPWRKDIEG